MHGCYAITISPFPFENMLQLNPLQKILSEVSDDLCCVQLQLEIYSRCYNEQPLVIQGAGAGNDTTAAGVLADILDLQDLFPST